MMKKTVGILLFENVEVLDFCGPFEVFSVTRLEQERPFTVHLIAQTLDPVSARGGLRVLPDYTLADCPPLDVVVIPGGNGVTPQLENPAIIDWIRQQAQTVPTITSVCTGSMLLGKAGVLDGRSATTHFAALDLMRDTFPQVEVIDEQHVVQADHIYTSAGISAGIDMALHVVGALCGREVAIQTARNMEYDYRPDDNHRRITL